MGNLQSERKKEIYCKYTFRETKSNSDIPICRSTTHLLYFCRPLSKVSIGSLAMYMRKPGTRCLRYDSQFKLSILKLKILRSAGVIRLQSFTTASLLNCHCCNEKYDIIEVNVFIFLYAFNSLKIYNSIKSCKIRDSAPLCL